ncbi:MAG TPA: hypothetical protein VGD81_20855 [Opitutaceae bacterium]
MSSRPPPPPGPSGPRGSTLVGVVLFTSVMVVMIASILSWSITERRLNGRNALRLESRNAAEALAEYGFSQIRQKFETRSSFSLKPGGADALRLPPAAFWSGGNVDTSAHELIGGTIETVTTPGSSLYYIDPADPNNEFDPLKGKWVFRRDVAVIARATVQPDQGPPITSHVTERISVRGAPLFAHAIFYNMDLEIFPGPNMTISGPVHTNGNLHVYPGNGSTLAFKEQVTATGHIFHDQKGGDASSDGASARSRTGNVTFANKTASATSLKNANGIWKDSTEGRGATADLWNEFRAYASQTWSGNVQTSAHGVANYTPVAIGKYLEDATPYNGIDNSTNAGRSLIEGSNYPFPTDPDYQHKMEVEQQKYANNAGLYVTVDASTGSVTLSSRDKDDPSKNKALTMPAGTPIASFAPYQATSTSVGPKITSGTYKNKYKVTTTVTTNTASGPSTTSSVEYRSSPPAETGTTVSSGMYDQHREKGIDLVELDMDALRKAVAAMAGESTVTKSNGTTASVTPATDAIGSLTPDDWTGIVYVEVKGAPMTDPITGTTTAATNPVTLNSGVRIINGAQRVPSFVGTNSSEGLTIATNAPVYVKGHFNADGNAASNSATTPESGETPAAIVGDAVTILSSGFVDKDSLTRKNPGASGNVEISAALLTGLTPTNKGGSGKSSGGAHNLPRFLEDWTNKATYIRGSLVALFESRIFTEPYDTNKGYYSPPTRNWGFNSMFREGRYPPGTPRVMSYRRVDFTDLTASDYQTVKAAFAW